MLKKLLRHHLVQNVLVLYGVQLTGFVLPLVTLPYLTRILGPANFGLVALGLAFVQYFWVVTEYGFSLTGTRRVAVVQEDPNEVSRVYSTVMSCKLLLLTVSLLAMTLIVLWVPKFRQNWELYYVSFLMVVGYALSPNWFLQGLQRMKLVAASDYAAKLISIILIFLLVRHSSDYLLAAAIQAAAFLVSGVIGTIVVFSLLKVRLVWPKLEDMRGAMQEGWPVFLSMASLVLYSSSNTVILGMVAAPAVVGYFSAASRLMIAVRALMNPISTTMFPHFSYLASRSREQAITFLKKYVVWLTLPFLGGSVLLLIFAPLVVRLLYGPKFIESAVLLRIMSATPVLQAIGVIFSTFYMLALGHEKAWARVIRRMTILNFVLLFPLLYLLPADRAVAITQVLLDVFAAASYYWFYRRTVHQELAQAATLSSTAVS